MRVRVALRQWEPYANVTLGPGSPLERLAPATGWSGAKLVSTNATRLVFSLPATAPAVEGAAGTYL